MEQMIIPVVPVIDYGVRRLCLNPYPGHPKGCPNYGKKKECPPGALYFDKVYDLSQPVFAIVNQFDLKTHVERMRQLHPEWSERQLRNCLYWQRRARNQLLSNIKQFRKKHRNYSVETHPEAMGVNVTLTLKNVGILLEWPPETTAYQVALAGIRRR